MKVSWSDAFWCLAVFSGSLLWYAVMRWISSPRKGNEHLVICSSANKHECCGDCPHSIPHDDRWEVRDGIGTLRLTCTANSACEHTEEPVRCVSVTTAQGVEPK